MKIIYDRHEDMAATTKRHPAVIRHRTGATRDGRIVAQDVEIVMDGGAYVTLSPVVLSRGTLHATGPYDCPNVRIRSRVVLTNTPPNGAFRGFGAPQTLFAAEMQIERLAERLGIDPLEIRRRNAVREGSTLPTGQMLRESVGAHRVLEACAKRSGYRAAVARVRALEPRQEPVELARDRPRARPPRRRLHGQRGGLPGQPRGRDADPTTASSACSRARPSSARVRRRLFGQIVAERSACRVELVTVETPDTARVPNSGPTVASRTCMMVGRLLRAPRWSSKRSWRPAARASPPPREPSQARRRRLLGREPSKRFEAVYRKPAWMTWDDKTYTGDAYEAYSYGAVAVELEIDKRHVRGADPWRLDRAPTSAPRSTRSSPKAR